MKPLRRMLLLHHTASRGSKLAWASVRECPPKLDRLAVPCVRASADEPPVDVEERARIWRLDGTLVAVAGEEVVGSLHVESSRFGFGESG
jgi:hypothetical protein